jgi:hypothetical protein
MHSVSYLNILFFHDNKQLQECAPMLHLHIHCLSSFKRSHASLYTRTVPPDGRERSDSRWPISQRDVQAFSFNALQPLLDLAVTVFAGVENSRLRLAGALHHLTDVSFTLSTLSECLPSGLLLQLITINLATHTKIACIQI